MAEDLGGVFTKQGNLHHVFLIGFHHKKGCVLEYAYPPLKESCESGDKLFLPEEWKFLPYLAMPDGAHNFPEDVVYFHLPPRKEFELKQTVYCVSYCRQVDANQLTQRDADITRGTVQKSVVILSKVPAFGLIHAKLQLPVITNAFLENFSQKNVLQELYDHINASLSVPDESHLFFGLSVRKLLTNFKHKLLILFKLILLEKRVVFYATPASELVGALLSLLSLFPRMIEVGLSECTVIPDNKNISKDENIQDESESKLKIVVDTVNPSSVNGLLKNVIKDESSSDSMEEDIVLNTAEESESHEKSEADEQGFELLEKPLDNDEFPNEVILGSLKTDDTDISKPPLDGQSIKRSSGIATRIAGKLGFFRPAQESPETNEQMEDSPAYHHLDPEHDDEENYILKLGNARLEMAMDSPEKISPQTLQTTQVEDTLLYDNLKPASYNLDDYGFPLNIFTDGNLCLPYISLQHHDLLNQGSRKGFVVGATNILFKTRKELSDVVIDVENSEIIFHDLSLQRQLALSSADLRFAEYIVSNICEDDDDADVFHNVATVWKGGDEWLRSLFEEYLQKMLSITIQDEIDPKLLQDYNEAFLASWKRTKNYRIWKTGDHKVIDGESEYQHPFHAQYSINDMKLRLHHRLQNSEQGRKIEGALSNANDTIVNTGRYLGSAIGSARTSLSSWFSSKLQTNKS
uniref:late secretory pathway protein AVL9 homolog n=1 Tax=Styela clava TaxID=7725 RepID=UPI00193A7213|nr:late secretory pathway protein AVL9 homolog [Styela clava]